MRTLTIVPAYGRDYPTKKAALAAWTEGADFRIADMSCRDDGRYVSSRDAGMLAADGRTHVAIRYRRLTQVTLVEVTR